VKGGGILIDKIFRFVFTVLFAIAGLLLIGPVIPLITSFIGEEFLGSGLFGIATTTILSFLFGGVVFGVLGFFIAPFFIKHIWQVTYWLEAKLNKMPVYDVLAGVIGLAIGLIIANLLGLAFSRIPYIGSYMPGLFSLVFGYLGINLLIRKREEFIGLFSSIPALNWHGKEKHREKAADNNQYKLLDTSVIIDGRIADICQSGFIEGILVIPNFVLDELQHIADSSDLLKRNRGRRGLDILNRIQKELGMYVQINDTDFEEISEVDAKLVKLAQVLHGKILTNDYNLNKVAEIQGVTVLNINELSNAVKPVVLPGEEMIVHIVKDGKELGQGVAYLDDGTMIVVEGGKKHMGETIGVLVTSVLQTAAGRMIFAKLKAMERGA
jgi:uncharacterized protein YacL